MRLVDADSMTLEELQAIALRLLDAPPGYQVSFALTPAEIAPETECKVVSLYGHAIPVEDDRSAHDRAVSLEILNIVFQDFANGELRDFVIVAGLDHGDWALTDVRMVATPGAAIHLINFLGGLELAKDYLKGLRCQLEEGGDDE